MTQVAEPEAQRYVGGGLKRKEDPKLVTGQGRYVDDITLPGMLYLAFARSPVAHANIASIDTSAAKEMPGWWPCTPAPSWPTSGPRPCPAPGR